MRKLISLLIIFTGVAFVLSAESLSEKLISHDKWDWVGVTDSKNPGCCELMKEGCCFRFYPDFALEIVDYSLTTEKGYWGVEGDMIIARLDSDDDELKYHVTYFEENLCLTLTEDNYLGLEPYCIYLVPGNGEE